MPAVVNEIVQKDFELEIRARIDAERIAPSCGSRAPQHCSTRPGGVSVMRSGFGFRYRSFHDDRQPCDSPSRKTQQFTLSSECIEDETPRPCQP